MDFKEIKNSVEDKVKNTDFKEIKNNVEDTVKNIDPNALKPFQPVGLIRACKKFHYPFNVPSVWSPDAAEEVAMNLLLFMLHITFILTWYCCVFSFWLTYVIGYFFYWAGANLIIIIKNISENKKQTDDSENHQE